MHVEALNDPSRLLYTRHVFDHTAVTLILRMHIFQPATMEFEIVRPQGLYRVTLDVKFGNDPSNY